MHVRDLTRTKSEQETACTCCVDVTAPKSTYIYLGESEDLGEPNIMCTQTQTSCSRLIP